MTLSQSLTFSRSTLLIFEPLQSVYSNMGGLAGIKGVSYTADYPEAQVAFTVPQRACG